MGIQLGIGINIDKYMVMKIKNEFLKITVRNRELENVYDFKYILGKHSDQKRVQERSGHGLCPRYGFHEKEKVTDRPWTCRKA